MEDTTLVVEETQRFEWHDNPRRKSFLFMACEDSDGQTTNNVFSIKNFTTNR